MKNPQHILNDLEDSGLTRKVSHLRWQRLHIDVPLFVLLLILAAFGLFILFSASNQNTGMVVKQGVKLLFSFLIMIVLANIPAIRYHQWAPWLYFIALFLLFVVLFFGEVDKGARRWINLGLFNFQPSEIMMLAMPMMISFYLSDKELPPKLIPLICSCLLLFVPVVLTAKQPDLGTAIIIAASGFCVLLLAGLSWRLILSLVGLAALGAPILWHFMHQYQRERVLTFLNPERDPLGSGYHIIQSKIAIGSGGFFGKGWLHGTQSHLQFLPAHATDFIFAVNGEELGFLGCVFLLGLFLAIFGRCLYISNQAQDTFSRLLAGSLCLTFIISVFINIGMVVGILPVVGVPLPLVSYGGSSMVTTMAGFGIIMSIHTHRKLWSS